MKPLSAKNTKISWVWWYVPVIPGTQEAEAGELLEPRGGGCSEPRSRHCTPAWVTKQNSVSKRKRESEGEREGGREEGKKEGRK